MYKNYNPSAISINQEARGSQKVEEIKSGVKTCTLPFLSQQIDSHSLGVESGKMYILFISVRKQKGKKRNW